MGHGPSGLDLATVPALVLCGGRGSRLGELGHRAPKSLLPIRGRPILWYILGALHAAGFRRFVLPLGFRGAEIRSWVEREARFQHE